MLPNAISSVKTGAQQQPQGNKPSVVKQRSTANVLNLAYSQRGNPTNGWTDSILSDIPDKNAASSYPMNYSLEYNMNRGGVDDYGMNQLLPPFEMDARNYQMHSVPKVQVRLWV